MPINPEFEKKNTDAQLGKHDQDAKGYTADIGVPTGDKKVDGAKTKETAVNDLATTETDPLAHPAYPIFKARIAAVLTKIGSSDDPEAIASDLWKKTHAALTATDAAYDKVATKADGRGGQRSDMGSQAYKNLLPSFDAITGKLTEMLAVHGKDAKTWAFWSTNCARAAGEANCEMSLETSAIGWVFDNMNLTGDWDMQLWGALSKAYALAAVSTVEGRSYHGFVGPGVGNLNIYAQVESPAVKAATQNYKIKPKFRFHAVAPAEGQGPWNMAFNPTFSGGDFAGTYASFDNRDKAIAAADAGFEKQQQAEIAAGTRKEKDKAIIPELEKPTATKHPTVQPAQTVRSTG
jgi:hypothetical protein